MSVLIVLAGLLAYRGGGGGAWLFDDQVAILGNESIRQVWPLSKLLSPPADTPIARRPLLTPRFAPRYGGASLWLAGAVAGLWAVHPLLTESILYITQRTELLMALWYLLALYSLIRSADSSHPARWHALTVLACALGMLSKEVMVTAPLVLCLYDWMFLAQSWPTLWVRRGRLYVGLALTWGVLAWLMVTGGRTSPAGLALRELPLARSLATQAGVILYYARLAVWPHPLVIDYGDWPMAASVAAMWPQMLAVALLILATGYGLIRRAPWAFLPAWSLAILAPTSLLPILTEVAAERRMYLPLIGVVALAVFGVEALRRRLRLSPRSAGAVIGIAVFACGASTWRRSLDYRSDVAMWTDAVVKRPNNVRAHDNFGLALGRDDDAIAHFRDALSADPKHAKAEYNLGLALARQGQQAEAVTHLRQAAGLRPDIATPTSPSAWR